MTPLAQFWIDKHDDFRGQCEALQKAADEYQEQPDDPEGFAGHIVPRTRFLLSLLHGHHQVEDFHYFPAFRAADPRLERGFDALAKDHEQLHESGFTVMDALNAFLAEIQNDGAIDSQRRAADACIEANDLLCRRVVRHLDDEEDLVIPLMLAHR